MTVKKLIAAAAISASVVAGGVGVASAHPNSASGKGVGGPLNIGSGGTPGKDAGAQGHWRGLECHAAPNSPVIGSAGDICVLD